MKNTAKLAFFGTCSALVVVALLSVLSMDRARGQITSISPVASQSLTLGNAVTPIVLPNPSRRALMICNVGTANDAWITPISPPGQVQIVAAANGAGSIPLSRMSAAAANVQANCLNIPPVAATAAAPTGITLQSLVTAGFNGITNAATTPLTIWEF